VVRDGAATSPSGTVRGRRESAGAITGTTGERRPERDRGRADPSTDGRQTVSERNTVQGAAAAGTFELGGDLTVNRLGFGAMRITGRGIWGEPERPDEARAVLRRAVELGVDLIDTADSYGPEVSERLIGETLHPYPEGLVIATKAGLVRPGPGDWRPNGRPEHIREALEGSLRRLRLERIDLYQLHRIDPEVPLEESLGTMVELRDKGKVRHIGLSEVGVDQLRQAREIVEISSVQNRYNLTDRGSEAVLEACEEEGIAFIPWFPLAAGPLARPGGPVDEIASRHDATPGQVALAWLLRRSPVMLPIPGTSSVAHLEENVAAASLELTDEEYGELSRVSG
jgi:aryl-alcohol dehydrogenase-like predicted oxidoreductase